MYSEGMAEGVGEKSVKNMETDEGKDGLLARGAQVLDGKELI